MINNAVDLAQAVKDHAAACKKKKPTDRKLDDTLADIRAFNEEHGTHLTYGQYIGLRDFGGY